jgi:hypothetical protein
MGRHGDRGLVALAATFSKLRGNYQLLAQSQLQYARFWSKSGHEAGETGKASCVRRLGLLM